MNAEPKMCILIFKFWKAFILNKPSKEKPQFFRYEKSILIVKVPECLKNDFRSSSRVQNTPRFLVFFSGVLVRIFSENMYS